MSARKGLYLQFWLDGYHLTPYSSNVEAGAAYDEIEAGAYNNPVKGYLCGRGEGSLEFEGFFNKAEGGSHQALKTVGVNKVAGVAYGNNAPPAVGDIACAMPVHQSNYAVNSSLDAAIVSKASLKSIGTPLEWGVLLANLAGVSADGQTASVDNLAASTNGAVGYLFLTGVSAGDTISVKIQHSPDNAVWADLITFSLDGAAVGAERQAVGGSVDRYVRVLYDVTGTAVSFDFAVIFSRK